MTTNINHTTNEAIEEPIVKTEYEISSWDELDLDTNLLRGIFSYGFEKPSPIQQKAIKPIMLGKDVIAQAQSGTGKTATFTIGALSTIDLTCNYTQVLVLSPTKELTIQTAKVFESLGNMMEGLRVQQLYGGSIIEDSSSFSNKNNYHVICG
jgi:superfamily II DNA/RNA helicase